MIADKFILFVNGLYWRHWQHLVR